MGITIAPRYTITDKVSAYRAFRYMQGSVTHDGSVTINLVNAALGLRFTLM
jgi:hypothetical protein